MTAHNLSDTHGDIDWAGPWPPDALALNELLDKRYSCRDYLPTRVDNALIKTLLLTAMKTASWCNSQPWRVHIAEGAATERFRRGLYAASEKAGGVAASPDSDIPFPAEYRGAYLARRREYASQLYASASVAPDDRLGSARVGMRNFELFGAPQVMILTTPRELGTYGAVDCGAFIFSFMLAARAFGIGAIAQASVAMFSPFVREFFKIDESFNVLCGISFGYENRENPVNAFRTSRVGLEDVATFISE